METEKKTEFTLVNIYSWKGFYLLFGSYVALFIFFGIALYLDSDLKYVAGTLLAALIIILFILRMRELRKTTKVVVTDTKLVYDSEELNPGDIQEIVFWKWNVLIKRNRGIRSHIHINLKYPEETDELKARLKEYAAAQNIKIKVE